MWNCGYRYSTIMINIGQITTYRKWYNNRLHETIWKVSKLDKKIK